MNTAFHRIGSLPLKKINKYRGRVETGVERTIEDRMGRKQAARNPNPPDKHTNQSTP